MHSASSRAKAAVATTELQPAPGSVHSSLQQRWNGTELPQMGAHAKVTCCSAGDGQVSLLVEMDGYSSSNSPPFSVTRQCIIIAQVRPLTPASGRAPS